MDCSIKVDWTLWSVFLFESPTFPHGLYEESYFNGIDDARKWRHFDEEADVLKCNLCCTMCPRITTYLIKKKELFLLYFIFLFWASCIEQRAFKMFTYLKRAWENTYRLPLTHKWRHTLTLMHTRMYKGLGPSAKTTVIMSLRRSDTSLMLCSLKSVQLCLEVRYKGCISFLYVSNSLWSCEVTGACRAHNRGREQS